MTLNDRNTKLSGDFWISFKYLYIILCTKINLKHLISDIHHIISLYIFKWRFQQFNWLLNFNINMKVVVPLSIGNLYSSLSQNVTKLKSPARICRGLKVWFTLSFSFIQTILIVCLFLVWMFAVNWYSIFKIAISTCYFMKKYFN